MTKAPLHVQDTVEEMAKSMATTEDGSTQTSAAELYAFMRRVSSPAALLWPECASWFQHPCHCGAWAALTSPS